MDGYDVIIEEIRACGRDAVTTGEDTGKVDLAATVAGVVTALPGGAAGDAAKDLVSAWTARIGILSDNVVYLGTDLVDSADEYTRNETAAKEDTVDPRYRRYE